MRLGHKILLLTLSLTLGMSATVLWVVTARVTARERQRAAADVRRVIGNYFDNLAAKGAACAGTVQLMTEEAAYRSQLALVDGEAGEEAQAFAITQLNEEILGGTVAQVIRKQGLLPVFHVMISAAGELLFAANVKDGGAAVVAPRRVEDWPYDDALRDGSCVRFIVIDESVFLTFGIGLRKAIHDAPALAYFVGFRVDDAWVRSLLPSASEDALTTLHAAVMVGRRVTAYAGAGAGDSRAALLQPLSQLPIWGESRPAEGGSAATPATQPDSGAASVEFAAAGDVFLGQAITVAREQRGDVRLVVFGSLGQALRPLRDLQRLIAVVTALAALAALTLSRVIARFVAKPVEQLVAGTQRVARGDFGVPIDIRRSDELGELAGSFNQMAAGLEQRDLIKDTFGKFVDPKLVEGFLADPQRLRLGGERRVQSIMFCDLANFTSLAEQLTPEELVALLNGYLGQAADIVSASSGIVDKFIGDAVVAFWGPPLSNDHAAQACRTGLQMLESAAALTQRAEALGTPPVHVRVGIATGEVLVGNIGSKTKYNYTVIGDVANLASRLEGINKLYGTRALATRSAVNAAGAGVLWRVIDVVRVVGRAEPVELCELAGLRGIDASTWDAQAAAYGVALTLYKQRDWEGARDAFDAVASRWPSDGPARIMAGRCVVFAEHPPDGAWDGVWRLDQK